MAPIQPISLDSDNESLVGSSQEDLEKALSGLSLDELKGIARRLQRTQEQFTEMLAELEAESEALQAESKDLHDTITMMMKEMQKLNIGKGNTVEPILDEGPLDFVGRFWEKVRPRNSAVVINEHVGEIKRKPGDEEALFPGSLLSGKQVVSNLREAIGPVWQRAEGHVKEAKGEFSKVAREVTEKQQSLKAKMAKEVTEKQNAFKAWFDEPNAWFKKSEVVEQATASSSTVLQGIWSVNVSAEAGAGTDNAGACEDAAANYAAVGATVNGMGHATVSDEAASSSSASQNGGIDTVAEADARAATNAAEGTAASGDAGKSASSQEVEAASSSSASQNEGIDTVAEADARAATNAADGTAANADAGKSASAQEATSGDAGKSASSQEVEVVSTIE